MDHLTRRQVLAGAGAAAALTLVGCGSSGGSKKGDNLSGSRSGAMTKYNVGDQVKGPEPLSFSIMMLSNSAYPYKADWLFWQELTKRTNITLQSTVVPGSDYN